jgi:hypothetical protein
MWEYGVKKLRKRKSLNYGGAFMNYQEKKKEEEKKEGEKQWPRGKTGKVCPACGTINELNAKFCQECGYKIFEEGAEKPKEPAPQIIQEKKEEKAEEKKEEVKEEVKEKKKSFFSPTQIESSRKSEEEIKNKIVISLSNSLEKIIKVKAVEVRKVQKLVYVADRVNCRIQKFTSEGEFITKWGSQGSGDGEFKEPFGITISKI